MNKNKKSLDWQNPSVFNINQTEPHTILIPYETEEQALNNDIKKSPNYFSLNGYWKFKWSENVKEAPQNFYENDFDYTDWDKIKVPSNWQMEGYGHPMFRNVPHTFPSDPPNIPENYNPTGSYIRSFYLPDDWQKKKIFLHFEGIKSASYVWINGQKVGYNQGGMEPAEYDITDYLVKGENKIAVRVLRYCDGTYLECQDMWRLSGIYRNVYLMAVPEVHIQDFFVRTEFDGDYRDSVLKVDAKIKNYSKNISENYNFQVELIDSNKNKVFNEPVKIGFKLPVSEQTKILKLSEVVEKPEKWSAEKPYLYTLILKLLDSRGEVKEIVSNRIGFREVEIKNQAIYVNGVTVKLNGVNSHMQHPETGRMMDVETMRKDLTLMKKFNINCVRTSHYPPNPEYLELADEIGLYIIDETGDEAHANEYLSDKKEWKEQYLDRMKKMVYRDRNHPSIIILSAGNESGWGDNICSIIKEGKKIDPSRPGWLYGGNLDENPKNNPIKCEDIVGPRYLKPYTLEHRFGKVSENDDPRPSFMDEYLSAAGNGLGGLDEYWDLIYKYPCLTGGAIWDWVSPGIKKKIIIIPDHSPANIMCNLMGTARLVSTEKGKAVALSGHDDWVEVYRDPELDITGNKLTLFLEVKPTGWSGDGSFLTKGSHQYGLIQSTEDQLEFYVYGDKKVSVKVDTPDNWYNNWHCLIGIYDGEKLKLYIDGKLYGEKKCRQKLLDSPFQVNIGRNAEIHGQQHEGSICEAIVGGVRIFDQAVSVDLLKNNDKSLKEKAKLWLDFEKSEEKGDFYSLGIGARPYGLVWPDRSIKPALWQVKKSAQPVKIEKVDLGKGIIEITNLFHFINLENLDVCWQLTDGEMAIQQGKLNLDIKPTHKKRVQIPLDSTGLKGETFLLIQFKLKESTKWAEKGHQVAWSQFKMPETLNLKKRKIFIDSKKEIKCEVSEELIVVKGDNFTYEFNKNTGLLDKAFFDDRIFLNHGPLFNVWRAPVANELDEWALSSIPEISPKKEGLGDNVANGWLTTGLNRLKNEVDDISIQKKKSLIKIKIESTAAASNYYTGFKVFYNYFINGNGEIKLKVKVIPHGSFPHWIPKIGLKMLLPNNYKHLKWFGRGPFENYPDRKTGARIGIYQNTVDNEYQPYLVPEDYGNKTDVRWLLLTDKNGRGLRISGEKLINISVHKFTTDNLSRANYIFQLHQSDYITLNIDHRVSGLGGSAISVLNKYRVFPGVEEFTVYLQPV